ncbi:MAG: cation diffusion facilitator family transporter [Thaumarchaeota archaeon]|nr:cation diffusion facilitator family transporter [Nitrososphaerota archaeon]
MKKYVIQYFLTKNKGFEEGKRAAWVSIWTLLAIGIAEVAISTTTGSLTLFADGLDSMADALVSFIVWFGIAMLHKPKSRKFHFGYAKIESFAAFVAAIVIVILGIFIIYHAYEKIVHPVETVNPEITMITLIAAGSISLHRAFRVRSVAKKYNLISLNLDAKNSIKDGSASFVGFASVLVGYFGIPYMDAIGGIIIAGYIFYMARMAFKESTLVLLDAVKNPELEDEISHYVEQSFNVKVDDVLIRPLGHAMSAQIHVIMKSDMTLKEADIFIKKIHDAVIEKFGTEETTVIPKLS